MNGLRVIVFLLCAFFCSLVWPASFTVTNLFDDADAPDVNPGNGLCADSFATCTLRAAIMETNALASDDEINFSVNGTIFISSVVGALPTITDYVVIDGESAPTFNSAGTTLSAAPPVLFIDGSLLAGSTIDGLRISGLGAADSEVLSIGVRNFPDNGIDIATDDADGVVIQGCHITGNQGLGISAINPDFLVIGQINSIFIQEFIGLGNMISDNDEGGVTLTASDSNQLYGNFIGMLANGTTASGNGGTGIVILGSNNIVGSFDSNEQAGNVVSSNSGDGIRLVGNSNTVYANRVGLGSSNGFFGNTGHGIVLTGLNNRIGNTSANSRNHIANNTIGILLGSGVVSASLTVVQNNFVGITAGALGNADDGIRIFLGDENQILGNQIINNLGHGINAATDENIIRGNTIGVVGTARHGNAKHGIFSGPDSTENIIGGSSPGQENIVGDNGINEAPFYHGMQLQGDGHEVLGNFIGVTPAGVNISQPATGLSIAGGGFNVDGNTIGLNGIGLTLSGGNHTVNENYIGTNSANAVLGNTVDGIFLTGASGGLNNSIGINNVISFNGRFGIRATAIGGDSTRYNIIGNDISNNGNAGLWLPLTGENGLYTLRFNRVNNNGNTGIMIFGSTTNAVLEANTLYGNNGIAIGLNGNTQTPNDPNDADTGPNRLMNYPDIQSVVFTPGSPSTLSVNFSVNATVANATYPLTVEAFWTDTDEPMQGRYFLTSVTYATAQALQNAVFNLPAFATTGGQFAMVARDTNGNSSELSPAFTFGVPVPFGLIFKDSFESPPP